LCTWTRLADPILSTVPSQCPDCVKVVLGGALNAVCRQVRAGGTNQSPFYADLVAAQEAAQAEERGLWTKVTSLGERGHQAKGCRLIEGGVFAPGRRLQERCFCTTVTIKGGGALHKGDVASSCACLDAPAGFCPAMELPAPWLHRRGQASEIAPPQLTLGHCKTMHTTDKNVGWLLHMANSPFANCFQEVQRILTDRRLGAIPPL
jgi:hypothetical protein